MDTRQLILALVITITLGSFLSLVVYQDFQYKEKRNKIIVEMVKAGADPVEAARALNRNGY